MIGDRIIPKPHHTRAAEQIVGLIGEPGANRAVLTVAGESGSGKSEIAVELQRLYKKRGLALYIFGQDDYFLYPPKTNDGMRKKDINHVGTGEVNLALLDEHLARFKQKSATELDKPLVVFEEDRVSQETIDPSQYQMAVAEGTYTTLLQNANYRVFINRTYEDTLEDRKARNREAIDDFSDRILEIEHEIISKHRSLADMVVSNDFSVTLTEQGKGRIQHVKD